mmetsp:Transcript_19546/g.26253  ORF Transcript_19546/g.26253 Transcript_19546/m.26253 type:complete len:218 (-) Transcript_19546:24-677(-)
MGKNKGGKKDKAEKQAARRQAARPSGKATAEQEVADVEAVKEIEERLQALTAEVRTVEVSIRRCAIEAKRAQLTCDELKPLGDDVKTYRQVGKMFLLQPKADLAGSLRAAMAVKSVEGQQLQQARGRLEAKVKSEANSLREIIGPERLRELFEPPARAGAAGAEVAANAAAGDGPVPLWGKARPAGEAGGEDAAPAGADAGGAGAASGGDELAGAAQ